VGSGHRARCTGGGAVPRPDRLGRHGLDHGCFGVVQRLALALKRTAGRRPRRVWIDPRVPKLYDVLDGQAKAAASATHDAAGAVHQDRINRMLEGDPRERKWDVAVHG
jgi:hypothetical protein